MRRCFQLAQLGAGAVSPNPLVGAVLVHEDKIIGEGWHQTWGKAHGEVNCINSVLPENQALIPYSTLYCNLEPCAHVGKTPPCADLIVARKIPRVKISNTDPNPLVAGKGLEKLRNAGIAVTTGLLAEEGQWLNRIYFNWVGQKRPYVSLKWAQSADGFLGKKKERTAISDPDALRLVHRWRAESDAILVGAQTARLDNPQLDVRYYFGKNPLRLVIDPHGSIPSTHHLLDDSTETWVFGNSSDPAKIFTQTKFISTNDKIGISTILEPLTAANKASLLVEGGANVLAQFLENDCWDEISILENKRLLFEGIEAPKVPANAILKMQFLVGADLVRIFAKSKP